jgi:SAM-dependent methyltransferase
MIIKDKCSTCNSPVEEIINIGESPPANNFVNDPDEKAKSYPLTVDYCKKCYGIQLRHCLDIDELFTNYTYMTPDAKSLDQQYKKIIKFLKKSKILNSEMQCLEIGSNTGKFLKQLQAEVRTVLGVEPAENIAKIARNDGVNTLSDFFGEMLGEEIFNEYGNFDIIFARHMFAHNPEPQELIKGANKVIRGKGYFVIENAYAVDTFLNGEIDQVYHEHMFYFSLQSIKRLMDLHGFYLIDFITTSVHGGSIVYIFSNDPSDMPSKEVTESLNYEKSMFEDGKIFKIFNKKISLLKTNIETELKKSVSKNEKIISYGAPAKAFTLFTYLKLNSEIISFCIDTTETKIGKIFPIFKIPILSEAELQNQEYDTVLVCAWNYQEEILLKSTSIFKPGTKLIFPLPEFKVFTV